MRPIEEIMKLSDVNEIYSLLTSQKRAFVPTLDVTEKEYDPKRHKVMDPLIRKRKKIKVKTDKTDSLTGRPVYKTKYVERCRTSIPAQQVLLDRAVGFLFSNEVTYNAKNDCNEQQTQLFEAVMDCFSANKIPYFDRRLGRTLGREREAAELWYYELDAQGKPSRIRVKLLSPLRGDRLFPHFNDYDKMDGFARLYHTTDESGVVTRHFDVYTKELVYQYKDSAEGLLTSTGTPKKHGFTKIPVIYYRVEETAWNRVQSCIERVEELLSNWGDTNDYFGTPSYFVSGEINGFADKGEQGRVYTGKNGAEMKVLSWDSSPESMRTELATLFNIIFAYSQIPDISFENMKTLGGNTSGVAIQLMFTDPHMKAEMQVELYGEMFTRRYNLVQNGIASTLIQPAMPERLVSAMKVEPKFTPFMPQNKLEQIQLINASNGGKPSLSQADSVELNPLVKNPKQTLEELQKQERMELMQDAFGSAL